MASGVALAASLIAGVLGWSAAARIAPLIAIASGGVYPARRALSALRLNALDMNVLMSIAVVGAIVIGEWLEAATVVFLFNLAQHLESRSMDRARQAIRTLMDLAPAEAVVVRHGIESRVSVEAIEIGEIVRVRPGEKIPIDGHVVAGGSDINQAPITGESLPVDKTAGDEVFAGTINGHGSLDVRAVRVGRDTTLAASFTWSRPPKHSVRPRRRLSIDSPVFTRRPSLASPSWSRSSLPSPVGVTLASGYTAPSCCW